ncbi:MAG TPA: OmpA family protein [Nevskiaceae bacterium]|nr:OmpA family protein [Nevskiaceae bacterium]
MKNAALPLLTALALVQAQAHALETQPLNSAPPDPSYGAEMSPASPAPAASPVEPVAPVAPAPSAAPAASENDDFWLFSSKGFSQNYLGLQIGYIYPNHHRGPEVAKGLAVEGIYGWEGANHWGWEANVSHDTFDTGDNQGTDFYRYTFGADLTYSFGDRRSFTPFLLVGLGGTHNDVVPDANDGFSYYGNAGVGFVTAPMIRALGDLRLRGEARWIYDGYDHTPSGASADKIHGDWRFTLGIEIPLFAHHGYMTAANEDQVGVVPLAPESTPAACKPVEAPTAYVDSAGCAIPRVLELKGVTFEFDKVRLRPDAETILNYVGDVIKRYPDMQVEIAGHTDSMGSDGYNLKLSQRRAQAVVDYLVKHGVPTGQITAHGYGERQPIASNDTEEGRERNRRVELRILNDVTPTTEPGK